ncbi:diguanylate cyclase domain-containing protein [Prochlorothrix hollandica]|uniref:diguanylate cyclase domain-containing protein n=1 Tax=Prochlorothrix hollandica TaxID=1223 RepID=UPI00034DE8DA|nr:diguanylate cyclase [Prochlorothrix hollandica]
MQLSPSEAGAVNILIIDDVPENIRVLSHLLEEQGYRLRKAVSGQLGIRSAQLLTPDLILLDIKMPGMDGYAVCKSLKSNPSTIDIPIIFISALDDTLDKVRAFEVGGQDYITKPFKVEEVLARIRNQLTLQSQRRQLQLEIKQRKQIEHNLNQSRQLITQIINTSKDGIAVFQSIRNSEKPDTIQSFQCILANPEMDNIFQKSRRSSNSCSLNLEDFIQDIDGKLMPSLRLVVDNGTPFEQDINWHNSTENINQWYTLHALKLDDGLLINLRNITERKQLELELRRQVHLDGLTQVSNRRYFDEMLHREWLRCSRRQQPLALVLCDVDSFKIYNDYHGHVLGDQCLIQVAQVLQSQLRRPGDIVARYGGEEFALLLPETTVEGAVQVAQGIRDRFHALQIPHGASAVQPFVTLSFGVTSIIPPLSVQPTAPEQQSRPIPEASVPQENPASLTALSTTGPAPTPATPHHNPDQMISLWGAISIQAAGHLVREADRLLYLAKDNGRDRIEYLQPQDSPTPSPSN